MNEEMDTSATKPEWKQDDVLKLLDAMKGNLPEKDMTKFKKSEYRLDWEKVAFNSYSADMCKQKWNEISREIRKFRTLTELIVDTEERIKSPAPKILKLKKYPDYPKQPLTPYFRFFMEKRGHYLKKHPKMSNLDISKMLSKKYKDLSNTAKEKYVCEYLKEKESYMLRLQKFQQDHPDLSLPSKK
ncbi:hypothetical protein Q8A67_000495 [Cirrhinus molitorella]|uniref:HMG box domain-containing protein n=1 Tax=Cirrhinus molitorella TaxID=172907 RepID=A0AA88U6S4_9TELE|nr:hypothetical protein Q8A67_000495 [Cirrhinus molitorella]